MEIKDHFDVPATPDAVWQLFEHVPSLVACMPGVELTEDLGGDEYRGRMNVRLGPMKPSFEGEARVQRDASTRSGSIAAKGKDSKGGSRADARVEFSVQQIPTGARVELVSTVNIMGQLAQFGRTNLLQDVSAQLTSEFANCLAAKLTASTPQAAESVRAHELQPLATMLRVVRMRVRRALRRFGTWLVRRTEAR